MAQPRRPRCMPLPALGLALALAALGGAQEHASGVPGNAEDQALDAAEKICASELDAFAACMEQEIEGQRAEHPSDAMQRCEDVHRIQATCVSNAAAAALELLQRGSTVNIQQAQRQGHEDQTPPPRPPPPRQPPPPQEEEEEENKRRGLLVTYAPPPTCP
eukprot:Tamp_23694.p1 GENE.Tamp_23694~~Tamp_23694.p1  ORF type:complete len:161 (+),score=40.44 Tamp_23694:105-587(+)